MYMLLSRDTIAIKLRELLAAAASEAEFRAWLSAAVIGDGTDVPNEDAELVAAVVDWIESRSETADELTAAVRTADALLQATLTNLEVCQLIGLVRGRDRLVKVLKKLEAGQLSRTAFLSFLAEQNWATGVKQRFASLGRGEIAEVRGALDRGDYTVMSGLLL